MKRTALITFFVYIFAVCIAISLSPENVFSGQKMPDGFVDLSDVAPSVVIEMRYCTAHNFIGEKIDGYNAPRCILTRQAAQALSRVQHALQPFSLSLKVYDCYRPQRAVDHFVRWAKEVNDVRMKNEFYPTIDKKNLFRDGYIAEKSGHSRGSTVDLTIVPVPVPQQEHYEPGQPLYACYLPVEQRFRDNGIDMGTGFDCFHELSHPGNTEVALQSRVGRMLLKTLMEQHSFRNYDQEWWHFTLNNEPFPDRYFDFPIE